MTDEEYRVLHEIVSAIEAADNPGDMGLSSHAPEVEAARALLARPCKYSNLPPWLMGSAEALLDLDANGVLVPHGIGGHARAVIEEFLKAHGRR